MLFSAPSVAQAASAGTLDHTYSGDGITKSGYYAGGALLIDTQGRPIVGGETLASPSRPSIVRYKLNGAVDTTFSGDGKMTLPTTGGVDDLAWLGSDILVLSRTSLFSVKQNGTLDLSYGGGDGQVTLTQAPTAIAVGSAGAVFLLTPGSAPSDPSSISELVGENIVMSGDVPIFDDGWGGGRYDAVVISPDGKSLYVAGSTQTYEDNCLETAATKLSTSDFSRLWSPEVVYSHGRDCSGYGGHAVVSSINDKLTVVDQGTVQEDCTTGSWPHVVRITPAGVVDMDVEALATDSVERYDSGAYGVALQGTKTVIAGYSVGGCGGDGPPIAFTLWRLTANGMTDTTFGGGAGFVATLGAGSIAQDVGIFGNKIIAAGDRYTARYFGQ